MSQTQTALSSVTVFMPVFNAANYVEDAIKSIIVQSHKDFSFLIIDDGSTDESLTKIRRAVGLDARCRVISRENQGIVATRNEGIDESRSDYIICIDADDVSHPDRLRRQVAYLNDHPDCVALGSQAIICDPEMMPIRPMIDVFDHVAIDSKHLRGDSGMCNSAVAMRRSAMIKAGGYLKEFEWAEDFDLFLRMAEIGRLANLPETLHFYRQHVASVGYSKRELQLNRTRRSVLEAIARREMGTVDLPELTFSAPTLSDVHRKWAWWALSGGNPKTARKHALAAISHDPWRLDNAVLFACALRGR